MIFFFKQFYIIFLILKSYLNELAGKQKGFTLTIEMKH